MVKMSRKIKRRGWYAGVMAMWLVVFLLVAVAVAGSGSFLPPSTGQGWFWKDRPPNTSQDVPVEGAPIQETPDAYTYPLSSGGQGYSTGVAGAQYPGDHLYVSWNKSDAPDAPFETKMFSGVAFSLPATTIPPGSKITKFEVTALEHPNGAPRNLGDDPRAAPLQPLTSARTPTGHDGTTNVLNGSPARNAMLAQGIIACPWPNFYGGTTAAPWPSVNDRQCASGVRGVPAAVPAGAFTTATVVAWKFDLTPVAANWADENPAFSLEPNTVGVTNTTAWTTAFHASSLSDPASAGPGVTAQIAWTPPSDETSGGGSTEGDDEGSGGSTEETSTVFGDGGSYSPGFQGSGGLVGDLASGSGEPSSPASGEALTFGVSEGQPADFWDLTPAAWLSAILGILVLGFVGRALVLDTTQGRPAGAVGALMRGIKGPVPSIKRGAQGSYGLST